MTNLILYTLSLLCLSIGVLVVTARSPVQSVLYLVSLFMGASALMIIGGAPFVGLVYLVVYVGAVAVLFLFSILLLNVPLSVYSSTEQSRSLPLVGSLAGVFMLSFLSAEAALQFVAPYNTAETTGLTQAHALASELFSHEALILILVGVILLLAMIGPVCLSMDHDEEELKRIRNNSKRPR